MKEIQVGNDGAVALVDDGDFEFLSRYKWAVKDDGYAVTTVNRRKIRMHHMLIVRSDGMLVDHRNRNRLDNRRENLREATPLQNAVNQALRKDNKSGFKGVTWNKRACRWKAQIRGDGKRLFLGFFHDAADAARAYDAKARELFGEFAFLNFSAD